MFQTFVYAKANMYAFGNWPPVDLKKVTECQVEISKGESSLHHNDVSPRQLDDIDIVFGVDLLP